MKKNLFWKIMAVLFFLWSCVWLWNSSIYIAGTHLKHNKLTGKASYFEIKDANHAKWVRYKKEK